jgi:integrase
MLTKDGILSLKRGESTADRGESRGLRVWNKDGKRRFLFRYRNRATGKLSTVWIGEFDPKGDGWTIAKARARARELRAQLDAGTDPRQVRDAQREAAVQAAADAYTVRQLCADFLEYITPRVRPRTLADYKRELDLLADDHGRKAAKDWTQPDVALWLDDRETSGHRAAGHALAAGRAAWNWATERGKVPASPWRVPKERRKALRSGKRSRVLTDAELAELVSGALAMPARTRAACVLMVLTGVRPGEACAARWASVDLKAGTWKLAASETKGNQARTVYLAPAAVEHLTRWKRTLGRGRHRHLFPAEAGESAHFTNARLAQSVADSGAGWRPHDLRRTVTTRLQALGCSDEVGKRILGHAPEAGAFGHYAHHTYEKEQREWLAKLAAEVLP